MLGLFPPMEGLVMWEKGIRCAGLWEVLASAHAAFSGMVRSTLVLSTCVYFEAYTLLAWVRSNWFFAQLDIRLTSSVGPTCGVGEVRATVRLSRFTAALRSGLVAGGSLRGIGSPRDQAGARMVAYDFQPDAKASPKLVGLLVPLDKGITHLHNAFICGFWFSGDTTQVNRLSQIVLYLISCMRI